MSALESIVRLINLSSEVISVGWTKPIALLWIDGDHRYDSVVRDFKCWEQYLTKDSIMTQLNKIWVLHAL